MLKSLVVLAGGLLTEVATFAKACILVLEDEYPWLGEGDPLD